MIPQYSIQEWHEQVPWNTDAMVEQDLIICRALISIFSDEFLASQLAFRGGTALHKLYLQPQPRYSEDIDLVQITPGPIKPIMFRLGEVMGLTKVPFKVENSWFTGEAALTTYQFEELMGTKLRALYQRKKGRDLFDLHMGLTSRNCDIEKILDCYRKYMEFVVDRAPSYKEFVQNMNEKMQDEEFLTDVEPLLRPEVAFNPQEAYQFLYDKVIEKMIVPAT